MEPSAYQAGLWYLHKLCPDSPVHTVCRAYRVRGGLDVTALRAALAAVTNRHEILRTTLVEQEGRPLQHISTTPVDLSFIDISDVAEQVMLPFDLSGGPLLRLAVARLSRFEHVLVLTAHQAILDDESLSILVAELSECYLDAVYGRPVGGSLPAVTARFAEYSQGRSESRELLDWWVSRLTPLPPPPALPVDRARPAQPAPSGGVVRFDWGTELAGALSTLDNAEPEAILLAAFGLLLSRYSAEDRLTIGVPESVRPQGFNGVLGPFQNLLVHNVDLSGSPTFRELVRRTSATTAEVKVHHELPFSRLVRELDLDRDPRRIPFCDTVFVFREPGSELSLAGCRVAREHVDSGTAATDLTLAIDGVAPTLTGCLEYRDALFSRASAERILGQLRTLLTAGLAQPDQPAHRLPLESPEQIVAAVRGADRISDLPPGRLVNELFGLHAARRPDAVAVSWGDNSLSYHDLAARAAAVTAVLGERGTIAGTPVAVRMPTGPSQAAALIGALDAGAHVICLGQGDPGERGRAVLNDLRPTHLVVDGDGPDPLADWYSTELGGRVIDVAALGAACAAPRVLARFADRAYVTYTSGSTGEPKGIPQSHATFAQFVTWFAAQFRIGPGARVAQWAAPGYDASLGEMFAALVAGATVCPVPDRIRANPEKIVDWLIAEQVTHFQTVPSFAKMVLKAIIAKGVADRLDSLTHVLLAGEALPGELANGLRDTLPSIRVINLYGPTESILATWHEIAGELHGTAPIGGSIPGRQVLVLDERGEPCPAGVTGELTILSPYITKGYLGAAAKDRAAFERVAGLEQLGVDSGQCYRTGDLGRRRMDGLLEFRGRRDHQFKFNGIRMELADIEAALAAHESVEECAVVAVAGEHGLISRVVAYVVPRRAPGKAVAGADVWRAALRRRFGKSTPSVSFQTMTGLPRNTGGKVDRRRLPDPVPLGVAAARPPQSWVEREMAAIWSDLLGGRDVSAEAGFAASGGHSLLIPQLLSRIRLRFGVEITFAEFFASPTLADLSSAVEARVPTLQTG